MEYEHCPAKATVLNPPADSEKLGDIDYNSVVMRVEFGETAALFTGDAGTDIEEQLLETHAEALDVDLYQAGHHRSSTSSIPAFLDAMSPQVTIISSAYESQYDHPHKEPLAAFAERDIPVYWTATHGTMIFESDGETWTAATQADATTDPTALREDPEVETEPTDPPTEHEPLAVLTVGLAPHHDVRSSVAPSATVWMGVSA